MITSNNNITRTHVTIVTTHKRLFGLNRFMSVIGIPIIYG